LSRSVLNHSKQSRCTAAIFLTVGLKNNEHVTSVCIAKHPWNDLDKQRWTGR